MADTQYITPPRTEDPGEIARWRQSVANNINQIKTALWGDNGLFEAPTVTTQAVSSVTDTTATGNGNVTGLGSPGASQHGVCWSTSTSPTILQSKTEEGAPSATGAFTSNITGLLPGTTYYVRAYVTNAHSTVYGAQVSMTMLNYLEVRHNCSETTGLVLDDAQEAFDCDLEGFADDDTHWTNGGVKLDGTAERLDPNTTYPAIFNDSHSIRIKFKDNVDTYCYLGGCANASGVGQYAILVSSGTLHVRYQPPGDGAPYGYFVSNLNTVFEYDGVEKDLLISVESGASNGIRCYLDDVELADTGTPGETGDMSGITMGNYSMNFDFKWGVFHSNGSHLHFYDGTFTQLELFSRVMTPTLVDLYDQI